MKKERLVSDAALKLFAKKGLDKTSIDEIAAKAGVAKGTIYYHYRSKEEIFLKLVDGIFADFLEEIETKIKPEDPPKEKLEKVLEIQFAFFKKNRTQTRVLLSEFWQLPKVWERDLEKSNGFFAHLNGIIKEGQAEGSFRKEINTTSFAVLIFNLIAANGFANETLENKVPAKEIENTFKIVILSGIEA
ncbi:MAG TPA: TetR/AcrR family transcriptional regulator [bacterium]|nr:TetR/AcrR family transcriptional regulator [bacterium]